VKPVGEERSAVA